MALVDNAWYVNFGNGSSTGYYAVAAWAVTTYAAGNIIRQLTTPAVGSERCFVCTTGGLTTTEPTWTTTRGALNTSGAAVLQECTGIAMLNGDLTNTPIWSNSGIKGQAITLGQVITNVAKTLVLICTVAGTDLGGSEPSWSAYTTAGATTTSGATWTTLGAVSTFTGSTWAAPHARISNCCTATWQQAGNTVFVGDNHAESQATAIAISVLTANATPTTYILSVDHTAAVPPTTVKSGASVSISGASNVGLSIGNATSGASVATWVQGITFNGVNNTGSSATVTVNSVGNTNSCMTFRDCTFTNQSTSGFRVGSGAQLASGQLTEMYNCTITLNPFAAGAANTIVLEHGRWRHRGGTINATNNPTSLITGNAGGAFDCSLEAVDMSGVTPSTQLFTDPGSQGIITIKDCALANQVAVSPSSSYPASPASSFLALIRSDPTAANTDYVLQHYEFAGIIQTSTTTVRTGGATNGVTPISWQLSSSSVDSIVCRQFPWQPQVPLVIWNNKTGSPVSVIIYGAGSTLPTTAALGFDVRYMGDSASCLGSFSYAYQTDPLAAGVNWTVDAVSSWSGSPANKFNLVTTFVPQKPGYIFVFFRVMSFGQTWYIDPLPQLG